MKNLTKTFKIVYFVVLVGVVFLTLNLSLDLIFLPGYLLPVTLMIGAVMFFLDAMIQRKARNKQV